MENPLVSVIIPTFNSEAFITDTIRSVQNQTYANWEIIIVDDCSTDKTVSIVAQISQKDNRIRLFQLETNSGTGIARNSALEQAQGRYMAFLDADDLWKPEKLKKQIDFLTENNLPFTFSSYDCIDEEGNLLNKRVNHPKNLSYNKLFFCNYIGNLTGIYDVNYFGKIAISPIRKRQDWMHWLTILKIVKTAQAVPESLAFYRIRNNSLSASKLELIKHNFAVYRNFHQLNLVESILCMKVFLFTQLIIKPLYTRKLKPSIETV